MNGRGLRLPCRIFRHALINVTQSIEKGIDLRGHTRELLAGVHGVRRQKRLLVAGRGGRGRGGGTATTTHGGADLGEGDQLHVNLVFQLTGLERTKRTRGET